MVQHLRGHSTLPAVQLNYLKALGAIRAPFSNSKCTKQQQNLEEQKQDHEYEDVQQRQSPQRSKPRQSVGIFQMLVEVERRNDRECEEYPTPTDTRCRNQRQRDEK